MNGDNGTSAPHSPSYAPCCSPICVIRCSWSADRRCGGGKPVPGTRPPGTGAAAALERPADRSLRWFVHAVRARRRRPGLRPDYQRELHALGQQRAIELRARAGLHVGDVLTWENSAEAVRAGAKSMEWKAWPPMAARLMTLARPGQILLSAVAESLTRRATDALVSVARACCEVARALALRWRAGGAGSDRSGRDRLAAARAPTPSAPRPAAVAATAGDGRRRPDPGRGRARWLAAAAVGAGHCLRRT